MDRIEKTEDELNELENTLEGIVIGFVYVKKK